MTHTAKLTEERNCLEEKILKLRDFIGTPKFTSLCAVTQNNLRDQLTAMTCYRKILDRRIDRE